MIPELLRASDDRARAVDRSVEALRRGAVIVLPTETTYGLGCAASDPAALDRLWSVKGEERRAPIAWHLASAEALEDAVRRAGGTIDAVQRRLMRRLLPGPITLAVELGFEQLDSIRRAASLAPGTADDGAELLVRVPARGVTREIIVQSGLPIVIASLPSVRLARTADEARRAIAALPPDSVDLIVDDGPVSYTAASTLVRLPGSGGFHVARVGAIDERTIRKRMARTLLFVCTGNTCRSPMAAAIARQLLKERAGIDTTVKSAGTSAGFGMEATPEGVDALRDMGIEPGRHVSTPLSRELVNDAEMIYAMTRAHLEAVLRFDPSARGRVLLLDPDGADIPDPIGAPPAVYAETARTLKRAIERRLAELPE